MAEPEHNTLDIVPLIEFIPPIIIMDKYVPDISLQCYEVIRNIVDETNGIILTSKINIYTRFFAKWCNKCDGFYNDPTLLLDFEKYSNIMHVIDRIHHVFTDTMEYWLRLGGNSRLHIQQTLNNDFDQLLDMFEDPDHDVRTFVQEFIGEFIQKYTPPKRS